MGRRIRVRGEQRAELDLERLTHALVRAAREREESTRAKQLRYYHTTDAADMILKEGFKDSTGSYSLATFALTGVFISDQTLDIHEGAVGDDVMELILPDNLKLDDYELVEEGKGYREWCVPADILNKFPRRLFTMEEIDSIVLSRWQQEPR